MRRLPALLLVLLVVTSGCSNYLPWSNGTPEPKTDSQANLNPPPGANTDWIFDSARLLSAHESVLSKTNYRKEVRIRPNHSTGPQKWSNTTLVAHAGDGRLLINQRGDTPGFIGTGGSYEGYVTNTTATFHTPSREGTQYRSTTNSRNSVPKYVKNDTQMRQILSNSDFTWKGTVVRNGTKLYRYRASTHTELSDVKSLSATVLVDERGFIHVLSGTLKTTGSRTTAVDFSYRFSEVESPPTKPNWVSNVPHISVKSEPASGVIAIEHDGGAVVPAGTTVRFSLFNRSTHAFGTVELSKPIEPGDVAYISVSDLEENGNGELVADEEIVVNQHPANESTIALSNRSVSVHIQTENWSASAYNRSSRND